MKKYFLVFSLVVAFVSIQGIRLAAQNEEVPTTVQTTFNNMYPDAIDAYWEHDGEEYLVTFTMDENSVDATFQEDGTWQQSITSIEFEDLPTAAITLLNKDFEDVNYYNISKIEVPAQVQFATNFETDTQFVNLLFDAEGKLVDKQVEDL